MKGRGSFVIALIILIMIFVFSNIVISAVFKNFRIDMTEENIYSLSKGTKSILNKLKGNITLKFYFSRTEAASIPQIKNYASNVRDLLNEYEDVSDGKINLEYYDPRPDTEEQEWAERYGIQAIPLQGDVPIYFGLAGVNELGNEDVIAFFDPQREELLEYDITRLVYDLSNPSKKVVGFISSLQILGKDINPYAPPSINNRRIEPWIFTGELKQTYKLIELGASIKKIPDDIGILIIIHPKDLSDNTLFAIDQFILNGGSALIFVDPYCEADVPPHDPKKPYTAVFSKRDSNMERLFSSWGVELVKDKVAADRNIAVRVNTASNRILPYVVWLNLNEDNISRGDVTTAKLESILMPYAGVLKTKEIENVTFTTLLETTNKATTIKTQNIGISEPDTLLSNFQPGSEKLTLALKISGMLKTAFPEGRPAIEGEEDEKIKDASLKESKEKTNIVVVADVDMITDRFSVRTQDFLGQKIAFPLNDNINFLNNALENLGGSDDLISIRSRGRFTRPFLKVQEIERVAIERWKDEEMLLMQKVSEINNRLRELIRPGKKQKEQVLSKAIQDEINKYRIERAITQKKLRDVRRKLRQDKEALGNNLFIINTFLIPFIICCYGVVMFISKRRGQEIKN